MIKGFFKLNKLNLNDAIITNLLLCEFISKLFLQVICLIVSSIGK